MNKPLGYAEALAALDRVRALHAECTEWDDDGDLIAVRPGLTFCLHCLQNWPCLTIQALDEPTGAA